ncbi:hypothetical protein DRP53_03245 [candidate division WOR-3 bacterium]|mgnify:CR=1 FL=1|uniref:Uncharacterized protein n=1 Tax=candidate division WOR-3 bacterium TaxID=2052148 RepID=A0A660SJE5_UNCW3|nr:MAG: hypothetical protein DRP53_03245 [candidate division WOR-3 bacterium]
MTNWALVTFILGLMAFLFNTFGIFTWFEQFWGLIMMLISLGMFTRIANKEREGEKEKLREMVEDLKRRIAELEGGEEKGS